MMSALPSPSTSPAAMYRPPVKLALIGKKLPSSVFPSAPLMTETLGPPPGPAPPPGGPAAPARPHRTAGAGPRRGRGARERAAVAAAHVRLLRAAAPGQPAAGVAGRPVPARRAGRPGLGRLRGALLGAPPAP